MTTVENIQMADQGLMVRWSDGGDSCIPFLWLRHNCDCDACVIRQTSEKRFQIFTVPADLRPQRASLQGTGESHAIHIDWPDGHQTRFGAALLQALHQPATYREEPWDGQFRPRRFNFDDFLGRDSVAIALVRAFLATGACVLESAPTAPGTVERLAPRLGPVREVLFERIHNVRTDAGGYNIAHTPEPVPPHNDMVSYRWPPSVQALHMLRNDCAGGDTEIVDGFHVLSELRRECPGFFNVLCKVPVPFRQFDDENETYACEPTIELDADGAVKMLRYSNQLMQAVPLDEPRLHEFYQAFHNLGTRLNAESAKARLRLEAGDLLLTAGHRVLHARTPLTSNGARHLQDAYFDHDNVRNHLTLLYRKLGVSDGTGRRLR